ncbi:MAG: hypothetical protein QXZ41_08355 [Ignisphaera sp.]
MKISDYAFQFKQNITYCQKRINARDFTIQPCCDLQISYAKKNYIVGILQELLDDEKDHDEK